MNSTEIKSLFFVLILAGSGAVMGCEDFDWSENPAAYEANLKRRCGNPYFPAADRAVDLAELVEARRIDSADYLQAENMFLELGSNIEQLQEGGLNNFHEFREKIDALIMFSLGVGGPARDIAERATNLREALIQDIRTANQNDSVIMEAIQRAENFHEERIIPFHEPIIAQLLRERSPIKEEHTIAAVLSESPEAIVTFMSRLSENSRPIIELEALTIIKTALDSGYIDPQMEQKIYAIQR